MKKSRIVLFCAILALSFSAFSQDKDKDYFANKNEINIVIDDIFAKNHYIDAGYYVQPYPGALTYYYVDYSALDITTPKIGIGYKHHFSKSAIRTKISFGMKNYVSDDTDSDAKEEYKLLNAGFNLGFEWHKNLKRVQIFYGADLFLNIHKITSEHTYLQYYYVDPYQHIEEYVTTEIKYKTTGYGVAPLIGIKYFIAPALSVSTEIKLMVESFKGENEYINDGVSVEDKSDISGSEMKLGPLGQVSINIHL